MGQAQSQGRAGEVRIAAQQRVHVDIGRERAAYTIEAEVEVPPGKAARWPLLRIEHVALVSAKGATVLREGGDLLLVTERSDETRRIPIALYFTCALWARDGRPPSVVRLPVLRSVQNWVTCTFHGYDRVAVAADPPLDTPQERADGIEAPFAATSVLALEWATERQDTAPVAAPRAKVACAMHMAYEQLWAQRAFVPSAVMDFAAEVVLDDPHCVALARQGALTVEIDAMGQALHWDWLELESDPMRISLQREVHAEAAAIPGALQRVDAMPAFSLAEAPIGSRTLDLLVDVGAVCGLFGTDADAPLAFTVHGRCHLALDTPREDGVPRTVTLPMVRVPCAATHAVTYALHQATTPTPSPFQLEVVAPRPADALSLPVDEGCLVELDGAAACIVAYTRGTPRATQPMPVHSSVCFSSMHHKVWPGDGHLMHHILLQLHGPVQRAHQTILLYPLSMLDGGGMSDLQAYVNGHSVSASLEAQVQTSVDAQETEPAPVLAAVSLHLPAAAVRGLKAQLELTYLTPWAPSASFEVVCPTPPTRVPVSMLQVHGTQRGVPRVLGDVAAHVSYTQDALLTTLAQRRARPHTVAFTLQSAPSEAAVEGRDRRIYAAMLCAVIPVIFALYLHERRMRHLDTHVQALAMALDVDLADGHWAPVQHAWREAAAAGHHVYDAAAAALEHTPSNLWGETAALAPISRSYLPSWLARYVHAPAAWVRWVWQYLHYSWYST